MGSERTVLSTPTDQPSTPHLDTLRTKRLQFFSKNQNVQNSALASKSAAPHADVLIDKPVSLDLPRDEAELDPLLLQDSCVPEHQKLRHVLAWAQNFIRPGPTVPPAMGQARVSPTNTDHVTHTKGSHVNLTNRKEVPTRQVLQSPQINFSSQSCQLSQPSSESQSRPLSLPCLEPHALVQPCSEPQSHPLSQPRPQSQPGFSVYETYLMCVAHLSCRDTQGHKETQGCKEAQLDCRERQDCKEAQLSCRETQGCKEAQLSCRETHGCKEAQLSCRETQGGTKSQLSCRETQGCKEAQLSCRETQGCKESQRSCRERLGCKESQLSCREMQGGKESQLSCRERLGCKESQLSCRETQGCKESQWSCRETQGCKVSQLSCRETQGCKESELSSRETQNFDNEIVKEGAGRLRSQFVDISENRRMNLIRAVRDLNISNCEREEGRRALAASAHSPLSVMEVMLTKSVTPVITPSDHTTTDLTTNRPAGHTATDLTTNTPAAQTTRERTANIPADLTTRELTANTPADQTTRERTANAPADQTTRELTANTPAEHTTRELTANTPADRTARELTANTPADHTTRELTANTPAGRTARELTANTPADHTTRELTANTPADQTTRELTANTPADHATRELTANTMAEHTTRELTANTPADHTTRELTANTPTEHTTAALPASSPAEGPDRAIQSGVQVRCHSGSGERKRRDVEGKKPAGSWPRRAVRSGSSCRRRFWEKSSMLWSSYPEGTLLPRMKQSTRPTATSSSVADCTPKDCDLSLDSSPLKDFVCPETPQHHVPGGTVFQPWLSLPDELWIAVLKLMSHSDLCHVAQTCHRLCRLANDRTLWRVVRIQNSRCLNADWLCSIGRRGPSSLTLYRCTDKHVTPRGLELLFAQSGGTLRELRIMSCSGPGLHGDKLLLPCSRYCPRLTNVDVSWTGATDTGIAALASATSSLEKVVVNGCNITDRVFKVIIRRHGGSLRKLEVFGCRSLSAQCLNIMASGCPNLKVVNLGKLPKITEACLTFIISRLKQLTSLDLTGLAVVRDQIVHLIARQCPELQDLTLRCCPSITDCSLIEISTYSASIRYLDVSGCSAVTDMGIQAVSMACQRLQYLDLSSTKTSNKGVRFLANYGSRHLHTVKISFCYICQDSLRKLCRYHTGLRLLHLYGACEFHNVQELRLINPSLEAKCDLTCVTPPGQLISHTPGPH